MFARLTTIQVAKEKFDEAKKIYGDSVIPAAKLQKGYQGAYLITQRDTGKGISITLWDSEEDLKAGEDSGYYQGQLDKFKPHLIAPPVRETYEVSIKD